MINIKRERMRNRNVPHPNMLWKTSAMASPSPPPRNPHSPGESFRRVIYPSNKLNHSVAKRQKVKTELRRTTDRWKRIRKDHANKSGGTKKAETPNHRKMK